MKNIISEFTFTFSRSSGKGGQNVNKVNSKATLTWQVKKTKHLSKAHIERFIKANKRRISEEGVFLISAQRFREQSRNIADCTQKTLSLIESSKKPAKKRVETKVPKSEKKKRIDTKKARGEIKKSRSKLKDY